MSEYFTEVNRNTFLILFKSKVDDDTFFKYVEKNFNKWGMADVDYDKKEKTIIGKSPAVSLSFWDKFPVKLNTVGLRSIIISKGDEKNSFLINVNTNEMFGNSHTIRFPTYFSKEINSKFARVFINKQTEKESENSDIKDSNNIKKVTKNKKLTAEEKIANVKKKNPSKLVWWISGAVAFVILLMVLGSGGNNSGTGYKSDYLVDYRTTVRNGQPYVMCTYQSGKKMYVKYFMDGSNQKWKNWGCKDDLNN